MKMAAERNAEAPLEEMLLVAISIGRIKDEYQIRYNPLIPDDIIIDALETALEGIKEGKAETKVEVNVKIGDGNSGIGDKNGG